MDKVWLKNYPKGVPEIIDPNAYSSLIDLFEQHVKKYPALNAFENMGVKLTYQELDKLSTKLAAYFQGALGLKKGDRLAIMLPNLLQYPVVLFGALKAGLTVVNVNPLYTATELSHQLSDSGAQSIIVLANFAHTVEKVLQNLKLKHIIITEIADLFPVLKRLLVNFVVKHVKKMVPSFSIPTAIEFKSLLKEANHYTFTPVDITHDDLAFLQYTGGTTGVAKGVELTHKNMIANIEQASAFLGYALEKRKETFISPLPLYHIFSLTVALFYIKMGGNNVLITNPRDIPGFIKELKKLKFTVFVGVNTLFNVLNHHCEFKKVDFSHLKIALGGGMAVQQAVAEKWKAITGINLLQGYGLTETSPAVTITPTTLKEFNGSIGLPLPSTEVSIRDKDNHELSFGETGELCVKGPQVMQGYWNRPDETNKVFTKDGWLRTGDIAKVDENGFVYIVDRLKDMILVSGFNVYPNEIEHVLVQHPDILEAGVVGIPNAYSGEVAKAFIVLKPDTNLSKKDVIQHCRKSLTKYKIPRHIEFREELPKTPVGKVLRRELR